LELIQKQNCQIRLLPIVQVLEKLQADLIRVPVAQGGVILAAGRSQVVRVVLREHEAHYLRLVLLDEVTYDK